MTESEQHVSFESPMKEFQEFHGMVVTQGFKNRRSNSSQMLHKTFPAGFGTNSIRQQIIKPEIEYSRLGSQAQQSNKNSVIFSDGSFTAWTKGDPSDGNETLNQKSEFSDPFANVAGPYYSDLMRANRSDSTVRGITDTNSLNQLTTFGVPLHNRKERDDKSTRKSKPNVTVYHAPASLPNFTPSLNNSKIFNHLLEGSMDSYELWLHYKNANLDEKSWHKRGNDTMYNYSAYDFKQTASPVKVLSTAEQLDALLEIPKPLPPTLSVEIYTMNQMIRSNSVLDNQHFISRQVSSDLTMDELKLMVIDDIIMGIEKAFNIDSNGDRISAPTKLDFNKIHLVFQYYNSSKVAWRNINNVADWQHAKIQYSETMQPLKLMYSLEKNSEWILLKKIQEKHQLKKEAEKRKKTQHISLKSVADALEHSEKLSSTRGSLLSGKSSRSTPASRMTSASTPLLRSGRKSTNDETAKITSNMSRSLIYPLVNPELAKMQEQERNLAPKRDKFAFNLESKLLKTKWA